MTSFPGAADSAVPNRYVISSRSHPSRLATDWNRTQTSTPSTMIGGALLIHGLTDSPYSMRAIASRLHDAGYYTLSLRMQGHGTVPGGLVDVTWEDWLAAVRMGARQVRRTIGEGRPLLMVGYPTVVRSSRSTRSMWSRGPISLPPRR